MDRPTGASSALYVHCRGTVVVDRESTGDSANADRTFFQTSTFLSSASSGNTPACPRRNSRGASRPFTSGRSPTTVNDIEHIESQSFNGVWVIKVFFQPSAKIEAALAQVTAIAQTITRQTPASVTPPLVITYNASSVPILQLGLSGEGLSEQQLNDFTMATSAPCRRPCPARASPGRMAGKCGKSRSLSISKSSTALADLITTGTDSTPDNAKALFRLARTDILRVFIDVPQADSPAVSKGTKAYLQLQEFPGEKFEGRITNIFRGDRSGYPYAPYRGAGAQCGRAALPRRLCPGSSHSPGQATMVVPSNALLFRSNGRQVEIVDGNGIVHLRNVTVGHDFGTTVEATQGVSPEDRIIVDPSDALADGVKVHPPRRLRNYRDTSESFALSQSREAPRNGHVIQTIGCLGIEGLVLSFGTWT